MKIMQNRRQGDVDNSDIHTNKQYAETADHENKIRPDHFWFHGNSARDKIAHDKFSFTSVDGCICSRYSLDIFVDQLFVQRHHYARTANGLAFVLADFPLSPAWNR